MMSLKFREPGKRPGTLRWARRDVASVAAAVEWMNQNKEIAFLPAFVEEKNWKRDTVAILGTV